MFNLFAAAEINLGRAGWIILIGVLGSAALSLALGPLGFQPDLAILFGWAAFPFAAWFIAKAARSQGRSAVLYGLASLLPPLAIFALITLYNRDVLIRLDRMGSGHEA